MKLLLSNLRALLKKNAAAVMLNLIGLSMGLSVLFIIVIQVVYDLHYDKSYPEWQEIHVAELYYHSNGLSLNAMNQQLPQRYDQMIPQIKSSCLMTKWKNPRLTVTDGTSERRQFTVSLYETTKGFFDVFRPVITKGGHDGMFENMGPVLITESTAELFFGDEDPIGKVIHNQHEGRDYTVSAVCHDFPENSSIQGKIFSYLPEDKPNNWNSDYYMRIQAGDVDLVRMQMNDPEIADMEIFDKENPNRVSMNLKQMSREYLYSSGKGGSKRINITLSLLAIGLVVILVALINFLNFSLAMVPARVRNVNTHRILGAGRLPMKMILALEGIVQAALAFVIALIIVSMFGSTTAAEFFTADIKLASNLPQLLISGLSVLVCVGLIGWYVAHCLIDVEVSDALKGNVDHSPKGTSIFRNILVTVQFASAIILICIAWFIKIQYDYVRDYSLGFDKELVVFVPSQGLGKDWKVFCEECMKDSGIQGYTLSHFVPGRVGTKWGRNFRGKQIDYFSVWEVAENFLDFFMIPVSVGEDFPKEFNNGSIILNRMFLENNGFGDDIVGEDFPLYDGNGKITGIIENINFESLHVPVRPMAFAVTRRDGRYNNIFFRLSGADFQRITASIEENWKKFSDEPFEMKWLDEDMATLYKNEANAASLIGMFGFTIVLIAVMGIYGMVTFDVQYRRREIALRKVNGAASKEIYQLLVRNIFRISLVAIIFAFSSIYNALEGKVCL